MQRAAVHIRASVRHDRQSYLQSLADEVTLADLRDPRQLYTAVRRAFPQARTSRRTSLVPLPQVLLANGDVAASPLARAERWRQNFALQEAGGVVDGQAYAQCFFEQRPRGSSTGPTFSIETVPTCRKWNRASWP